MMKLVFNAKLSALVLALSLLSTNAHADSEARKAILELRAQFKGMVQTVQEQQNKITQLSDEVARLRGEQEVVGKTLVEVKSDADAGYANVDKRLQSLEPVPIEVRAQKSFEAAQALVQKGNYASAANALSNHARIYPNSEQAADVAFLRGAAAYGTKNYKMATTYLSTFMSKYPNHEKMPDALLILGNVQVDSGKQAEGFETLKKLVSLYPDSDSSKTAVSMLNGK